MQDYVLEFLLVATYFVYPTVTATLFQTFSCEKVHLGRFLHRDFAINCDAVEHKSYELLAMIAIVLFSCGVPLLFWALLFYKRHNLMHKDAQYLGFFFSDYKAQYWYWEVRAHAMQRTFHWCYHCCGVCAITLPTTFGLRLEPSNFTPRASFAIFR